MDERHRTESAIATEAIETSGNGNARNELPQLAERHGSGTTTTTLVTVTPVCGNAKKKRTRRRAKARPSMRGLKLNVARRNPH